MKALEPKFFVNDEAMQKYIKQLKKKAEGGNVTAIQILEKIRLEEKAEKAKKRILDEE